MANRTVIKQSTPHIDRAALSFQELRDGILIVKHQLNLDQQRVIMGECGLRLLSLNEMLNTVLKDPDLKKTLTGKIVRISGLDPNIESGTYAINKEDGRVDTSRMVMSVHEDYKNNHDPETHIMILNGCAPLSLFVSDDVYTKQKGSRYTLMPALSSLEETPISIFSRDYLSRPNPQGSVFNYWTILNANKSALPPPRLLPND